MHMRIISAAASLLAALWLPVGCASECTVGDDFCNQTTAFHCVETTATYGGTVWRTEACGIQSQRCVTARSGELTSAFCAESDRPNDACRNDGRSCDDNSVITCKGGFVVDRDSCGPLRCASLVGLSGATCADPRDPCYGRDDGFTCRGDKAVRCEQMRALYEVDCESCEIDLSGNAVTPGNPIACGNAPPSLR